MRMVTVGSSAHPGYTGAELLRLAAQHPEFEVVYATGDTQAGTAAAALYPSLAAPIPTSSSTRSTRQRRPRARPRVPRPAARGEPHGARPDAGRSRRLRRRPLGGLPAEGSRRCTPTYYGFEHDQPELLADAVYGLPETASRRAEGRRGWSPRRAATSRLPRWRCAARRGRTDRRPGRDRQHHDAASPAPVVRSTTPTCSRNGRRELSPPTGCSTIGTHPRWNRRSAPRCSSRRTSLPMSRGILATCYARPARGIAATTASLLDA